MTDILYQLFRPWGYLKIKHPSKSIYDYWVPVFLTLITWIPLGYLYCFKQLDVFSTSGLVKDLISFIATLPGFYLAALAAIATFQKNDIDELMPVSTKMNVRQQSGNDVVIDLTRRRFLCALFSFLTAQSIVICIGFYIAIHLVPSLKFFELSAIKIKAIGSFVLMIYFFLFWQLMSATALGLYYLGDRLHHPKA